MFPGGRPSKYLPGPMLLNLFGDELIVIFMWALYCMLQRVMMQIVQELCKRPGLNRTGFDMPTIYVPNMNQKVSIYLTNIPNIFCNMWYLNHL